MGEGERVTLGVRIACCRADTFSTLGCIRGLQKFNGLGHFTTSS